MLIFRFWKKADQRTSIRHDILRETIEAKTQSCIGIQPFRRLWVVWKVELSDRPRETISDSEYCGIAIGFGEISDKVYSKMRSWSARNRQSVQ